MRTLTPDERHALARAPLPPLATHVPGKSWAGVLTYDSLGGYGGRDRGSVYDAGNVDKEANFGDFHVMASSIQPRRGK